MPQINQLSLEINQLMMVQEYKSNKWSLVGINHKQSGEGKKEKEMKWLHNQYQVTKIGIQNNLNNR